MKLLHTSDWHLGMTYRNGASYGLDQRFFIKEICRIAVENKVEGIMISGDIFDKSIASQEALQIYDDVMTYICMKLDIPVYIIAGNHDGAERLSSCNELLRKSGLYICGSLKLEPEVVHCGDVDIYMLPWISTDKVKSIYPEEAKDITSMEDAYKLVLDKYREKFVDGHKNILMSHAFIVNAETSISDRAAEVGKATMVGAGVFEGFDYVALGHIHGPQQINEHIRYSGTPMAYSFGKEEKQEKSVTIYDTDTAEIAIVPVPALYKRATLKGTFDELCDAKLVEEHRKAYVRLEITDRYVGLETIAALREKYENLLEVSGKGFEKEDAKITMTIDEFENASMEPAIVFDRFCKDIMAEAPGEHILELFNKAVSEYEKEAVEY